MDDLDGTVRILGRRLTALEDAIRRRADWDELEFISDQLQSTYSRLAGTRRRPSDLLRLDLARAGLRT